MAQGNPKYSSGKGIADFSKPKYAPDGKLREGVVSTYSAAQRLNATQRAAYGIDYSNTFVTMVRRSASIAKWKMTVDNLLTSPCINDQEKSVWKKSQEFFSDVNNEWIIKGLVAEAPFYGQQQASFTTRSHNASCKTMFTQWRDHCGIDYPVNNIRMTVEVPSDTVMSLVTMLSDMRSTRDAAIGDSAERQYGIKEEHYEKIEELIGCANAVGAAPDWFKADRKSKKSGRLVIQDMMASWIRIKVKKGQGTPEELAASLKLTFTNMVTAKVIDDAFEDATTMVSQNEQEANIDRLFQFSWLFRSFNYEEVMSLTNRFDMLITKPVGADAASIDGMKMRVASNFSRISDQIMPMAKGELDGHKYQSPMLITAKRLMNCLAVRVPSNCTATMLQAIGGSDNPFGYIVAQYMVDKLVSDRAVARSSYWMLHRRIHGFWDTVDWTGRMKGNALSVDFQEVEARPLVINAALKQKMTAVAAFADATDSRIERAAEIGSFDCRRLFYRE